jgi:hypothetical protein
LLSPHHRLHGVALLVELDETLAVWDVIARRTSAVADAVTANLATPCVRNSRTLLVCGLAHAAIGDDVRARELESDSERLAGEGHDWAFVGPRIRFALLRGELEKARILAEPVPQRTHVIGGSAIAARLDAFAALRDAARVEALARPLLQEGAYVEPFALRALGLVRGDDELLARAHERFEALGLAWHATQTEALSGR